jgi:TolB-like protein
MGRSRFFRVSCAFIPVILAGCAATVNFFQQGEDQLARKEYDAAVLSFETARKNDPENAGILREMGVALYRKAEYNRAMPLLLEAFIKDSTDGRTLFYLGTTFEIQEDYPRAMDIYRRCAEINPNGEIRSAIEARLAGLVRRQMEEDAKAVLAREASLDPEKIPDNTIAVLYFRNMGNKRELDPIQKGLADMIITDLSKVKALSVVERVRMQKMIDEIGLGQTGIVDEAASPRMGKLLGASKLIQGSFMDLAKEAVRMDAGIIQVKQGKAVQPRKIQGKMARFFELEKDLVFGILDRMAVPLTQAEKDEIRVLPTENLLAFMAYCRALDFEDKGMFLESGLEYKKALQLDPGFKQAGSGAERAEKLSAAQIAIPRLEELFVRAAAETNAAAAARTAEPASKTEKGTESSGEIRNEAQAASPEIEENAKPAVRSDAGLPPAAASDLFDRMMQTAGVLDVGFLPGVDSRKPAQEQGKPGIGNSANIEIRVDLPEPPNVR